MTQYLDAMREARYAGPAADIPPVVLAALGPRMAALAGEKTAGAYPYFTTDAHVREVRGHLGPEPFLASDMAVVFAADRADARGNGNTFLEYYLGATNYRNNLLRLGWTEADLEAPGSDALFDAIVAWGSEDAIRARVAARFAAGADHIAFNLINRDRSLPLDALEKLARTLGLWER
jgi:probable F420-dependent oxidoreductase